MGHMRIWQSLSDRQLRQCLLRGLQYRHSWCKYSIARIIVHRKAVRLGRPGIRFTQMPKLTPCHNIHFLPKLVRLTLDRQNAKVPVYLSKSEVPHYCQLIARMKEQQRWQHCQPSLPSMHQHPTYGDTDCPTHTANSEWSVATCYC